MGGEALFQELLEEALMLLMLIGSAFTLIIGLLLLLTPQQVFELEQRLNSWVSMRRGTKPLEQPHNIDAQLYRLHRPLGLFILLSCAYILYQLAFHYDARAVARLFMAGQPSEVISEWLAEALFLTGIVLNLLLIPFGALFALRPSSLKGFEGWANRWISTRKGMRPLEQPYTPLDALTKRHPHLLGALIVFFSLNNLYFFLLQVLKKST